QSRGPAVRNQSAPRKESSNPDPGQCTQAFGATGCQSFSCARNVIACSHELISINSSGCTRGTFREQMESRDYRDLKRSLNLGHKDRPRHFCPRRSAATGEQTPAVAVTTKVVRQRTDLTPTYLETPGVAAAFDICNPH